MGGLKKAQNSQENCSTIRSRAVVLRPLSLIVAIRFY